MSERNRHIDAVIFDLGGVLVDWNPRYLYRKLSQDEAAIERFLTDVCNQKWNERQDAGRPFADAISELTQRFPQHDDWIRAYHARWPEMLGGAIAGTVDILASLRRNPLKLLALSNWSAETFPHALERYEFLRWFDEVFVSGRYKMKKPDPAFFRLLLDKHKINPVRAIFIDDVAGNVEAARHLGLNALQFTSPDQLRAELKALGLTVR